MTVQEHLEQRACRSKCRYLKPPARQVDPRGFRLRAYKCPFCDGYHLTKRPFFETNDFYDGVRA